MDCNHYFIFKFQKCCAQANLIFICQNIQLLQINIIQYKNKYYPVSTCTSSGRRQFFVECSCVRGNTPLCHTKMKWNGKRGEAKTRTDQRTGPCLGKLLGKWDAYLNLHSWLSAAFPFPAVPALHPRLLGSLSFVLIAAETWANCNQKCNCGRNPGTATFPSRFRVFLFIFYFLGYSFGYLIARIRAAFLWLGKHSPPAHSTGNP